MFDPIRIRYPRWIKVLWWLSCPIPWWIGFAAFALASPNTAVAGQPMGMPAFVLSLAGAYWLALVFHETGHAAAAWCFSRPIQAVSVWPIRFYKSQSRWRLAWNITAAFGGEVEYCEPVDQFNFAEHVWIGLAGPIANLFAFGAMLLAAHFNRNGSEVTLLFTIIGTMNLVAGFYALGPRGNTPLSDGDIVLAAFAWRRRFPIGSSSQGDTGSD